MKLAWWALAMVLLTECKTAGGSGATLKNSPRSADQVLGNPAHYEGPFTIAGPWTLTRNSQQRFGVPETKYYGTMQLMWDDTNPVRTIRGDPKFVRDMHYRLGGGEVGIRPIPVSKSGSATVDGHSIRGSELVDELLRTEMSLGSSDPIYAMIAYSHPEEYIGTIAKLPKLKTENGLTHMGAYIGDGATRNAPITYGTDWGLTQGNRSYPANISSIKLAGVPYATTNRNMQIVTEILNKANGGVKFAQNYKFDWFRTWNLKEALEFYRIWVTQSSELSRLQRDAKEWLYCAEHITQTVNIGLNVPMSEAGHVAIWGDQAGREIYQAARERYREVAGSYPPEVDFEPLWKQAGILNPSEETGYGVGVPWPPEATSDLVANFVEQYANWMDVGSTVSAGVILGFMEETVRRMRIEPEQYLTMAGQAIAEIVAHEAMTVPFADNTSFDQHVAEIKTKLSGLTQPLGAAGNQLVVDPTIQKLAALRSSVVGVQPLDRESVYDKFLTSIATRLERFRQTEVNDSGGKAVKFYTPPAILHRIVNGMHPAHPLVEIKAVATAFNPTDVNWIGPRDQQFELYARNEQPQPQPAAEVTPLQEDIDQPATDVPVVETPEEVDPPPPPASDDSQTEDRAEAVTPPPTNQTNPPAVTVRPPRRPDQSNFPPAGDKPTQPTEPVNPPVVVDINQGRTDQTPPLQPPAPVNQSFRQSQDTEASACVAVMNSCTDDNSCRRTCNRTHGCGWSFGIGRCIYVHSRDCSTYPDRSWCQITPGCSWQNSQCVRR